MACARVPLSVVQYLLETGNANVEATNNDGWTPLMVACQKGRLEVVRYLLKTGNANVDATATNGATSFYIACHARAVRM